MYSFRDSDNSVPSLRLESGTRTNQVLALQIIGEVLCHGRPVINDSIQLSSTYIWRTAAKQQKNTYFISAIVYLGSQAKYYVRKSGHTSMEILT